MPVAFCGPGFHVYCIIRHALSRGYLSTQLKKVLIYECDCRQSATKVQVIPNELLTYIKCMIKGYLSFWESTSTMDQSSKMI